MNDLSEAELLCLVSWVVAFSDFEKATPFFLPIPLLSPVFSCSKIGRVAFWWTFRNSKRPPPNFWGLSRRCSRFLAVILVVRRFGIVLIVVLGVVAFKLVHAGWAFRPDFYKRSREFISFNTSTKRPPHADPSRQILSGRGSKMCPNLKRPPRPRKWHQICCE